VNHLQVRVVEPHQCVFDFSAGDPVEQIFKLRKKNKGIQQGLRPGEEKMKGVDCAIDAVVPRLERYLFKC
jgi:hypothetical protein